MRNTLEKIKKLFKKHHSVVTMELQDRKDFKVHVLPSSKKVKGALKFEFNLDTLGVRQIVEMPMTIHFCTEYRFLTVLYKKRLSEKIENRVNYKHGMVYCESVTKKGAKKKFQKFMDELGSKLSKLDSISKK